MFKLIRIFNNTIHNKYNKCIPSGLTNTYIVFFFLFNGHYKVVM